MAGRITIFNKHGKPKVEVEADFHCNWVRNDYGKANFSLSLKDSKTTERNLRFGNLIMYEASRSARLGRLHLDAQELERGPGGA